jgi:hypothetical protein
MGARAEIGEPVRTLVPRGELCLILSGLFDGIDDQQADKELRSAFARTSWRAPLQLSWHVATATEESGGMLIEQQLRRAGAAGAVVKILQRPAGGLHGDY